MLKDAKTCVNMRTIYLILLFLIFYISIPKISIADENFMLKKIINTDIYNKLIGNEGFESTDTVTRYECVTAIMKAIGATEDIARDIKGFFYDSYSGVLLKPERSFFDGDGKGPDFDFVKYYSKETGYISLAFYYGIAKGEIIGNHRYFYFDRPVTAKETAAFMMRCLRGPDLGDLNETFAMAKESGLIKEEDVFYGDGDSLIAPDNFCIMLQRFLNQPRYLYFDEELYFVPDSSAGIQVDRERSITYLQYLQSRQDDTDESTDTDDSSGAEDSSKE